MRRQATIFLSAFVLLILAAVPADAQDEPEEVTVREINAIPQDVVDSLEQVGADLDIDALAESGAIFNQDLVDSLVTFTAVVVSDPLNSGLASVDDDGEPGRIHIFMRDTMATEMGLEGMGIQVVDGNFTQTGSDDLFPGDVVTVTGVVSPFATTMQLAPETIEIEGSLEELGLPDSLLAPVELGTPQLNTELADGVQINWSNLEDVRGQYVRLENAVVVEQSTGERPNWAVSTDGGATVVSIYDTSIRYRNDTNGYPDRFNKREDDFVPPPIGSTVNLQGYITWSEDDPFGFGVPTDALLNISPMADSDLEILSTPPLITDVETSAVVPGDEPVVVTANIEAGEGRSVTSAQLKFYTSEAPENTTTVDYSSESNGEYTFEIPAQSDGEFVTFWIEAVDNTDATASTSEEDYRVLFDGINDIADIQMTASGGFGDSPFAGDTTDMDLTVIVQSRLDTSGIISVQDMSDLANWSGIRIEAAEDLFADLDRGDSIRVTNASVVENFDVTMLTNVTYEHLGAGTHLGYKELSTAALQDDAIAEAHEGMLLYFDGPMITEPDEGFGEWSFTTGEADESVKADDLSEGISSSYAAENFEVGETLAFLQGVWDFSFGEYKLLPEDVGADVGATVANENNGMLPDRVTLGQNYPNPFNGSTTITYTLNKPAEVTIEVFDILGRRLSSLVDARKAAGAYTVEFASSDLPSGVYFYRLNAGETTITKKMLHVK